jgi:carboxypeptidase A4
LNLTISRKKSILTKGEQGQSRQPCAETYSGQGPFSEPESRAQQNFFAKSGAGFKAFLTFHRSIYMFSLIYRQIYSQIFQSSYGQYVLYPWGYDRTVPADHAELDRVGKLGAQRMKSIGGADWQVGPSGKSNYPKRNYRYDWPNKYLFQGTLLYAASGGSDDWAKSLNIKYAYTVELRDSGRYGFILPASEIIKSGKEAFGFLDVVVNAVSQLKWL